jgi:hypothetical protein
MCAECVFRYPEKIANAKWEVKELGIEHNGYVHVSRFSI